MKNLSIIVAVSENFGIGKNNDLLWHIPDDLKRFKKLTTGHTIIMGKKTYESLPVKPLPNRVNIVITDVPGETFEGCEMAYSIEEAIAKCPEDDECFVIGGGMIYKQFLDKVDKLYITFVHKNFAADTFFPEFDMKEWDLVDEENHQKDGNLGFSYTYTIYTRKPR